jgi:WS/DGAT/MGAT family acyltransferase
MRWTISAIVLLDGTPDWNELVARFERLSLVAPRLRQRIVEPPLNLAPPRWTTDPYFDLDFHLRRVAAPSPGDLRSVLELARTSAMGGLDRERPLWQATFVEHLADGASAVVLKMHHALTDGIGGMQLAVLLADPLDGSEPPLPPPPPRPEALGGAALWRDVGRHHLERTASFAAGAARQTGPTAARLVRDPIGLVQDGARLAGSLLRTVRPISDTMSPVMRDRGFSWHFDALEVPFDDLHRAAKRERATLNDAFVAAITGGLRRYHEQLDHPVDELRMSMPISTRTASHDPGGNHVAIIRFVVPVSTADPAERMRRIHEVARAARDEPAVPYTDALMNVLIPVTPMAVGPMAKHMDFTASNVPGIPVEGRLCGVPVRRFFPFGPTGGAALNVTMISYAGTCCVGINCDTTAVPDTDRLRDCLAAGFDEVVALGRRRTPRR